MNMDEQKVNGKSEQDAFGVIEMASFLSDFAEEYYTSPDEAGDSIKRMMEIQHRGDEARQKIIDIGKYIIKYDKGAQDRCVTTKDYIDRVLMMPPEYGTPFRVGCSEDNNKIMLYHYR